MRNGYREIYAPWRDAVARRRTLGISAVADEGSVLMHVRTELPNLAYYDLKYLIDAKGSMEIEVSFKPFSDSTPPLPRLGLIAGLAGDLQRVDLVRARAARNTLGSKDRRKTRTL